MKTTTTTNESFIKEYQEQIISKRKQIVYCKEQIASTDEKWVIKEYESGINGCKLEIERLINIINNIKAL